MRAIIHGNRYDTESAILIGEAESAGRPVTDVRAGRPVVDYDTWSAGLYKTKRSGAYFLAGEGGWMTRFARPAGQDGGRIIPLKPQEALEWAEEHLDPETLETHFGDLIEDA